MGGFKFLHGISLDWGPNVKQHPLFACAAVTALLFATPLTAQEGIGQRLEFELPSRDIPRSGLCRVFYPNRDFYPQRDNNAFDPRPCNGIENTIVGVGTLQAVILYRPKDDSDNFRVCWMSRTKAGVVDGIDLYSVKEKHLVREILPRRERTAENTRSCTWDPADG